MTCLEIPTGTLREGSSPVLETERLILRAPRLGDAKAVAALANDKRIAENTRSIPHPYTRADAEDFISSLAPGATAFLITRTDDTLVGGCGLTSQGEAAPELGYWLGVKHWGKGYGTEAVRALIDFAFAELEYESLQAGARVTNPASRRVLEKCGFQWTGAGLRRVRALNSSAPIDRFRLDRGLWASLKSWGRVTRLA